MAVQAKKKPLAVRIDPELFEAVDRARGDVSRTRFVERALEKATGYRSPLVRVEGDAVIAKGALKEVLVEPEAPKPQAKSSEKELQGLKNVHDSAVQSAADWALERQRRLNEGKGLK